MGGKNVKMERTKEVTKEEKRESLMRGTVTEVKTLPEPAPISIADSSIDLSICFKAVTPERIPIGKDLTMKMIMMMSMFP